MITMIPIQSMPMAILSAPRLLYIFFTLQFSLMLLDSCFKSSATRFTWLLPCLNSKILSSMPASVVTIISDFLPAKFAVDDRVVEVQP